MGSCEYQIQLCATFNCPIQKLLLTLSRNLHCFHPATLVFQQISETLKFPSFRPTGSFRIVHRTSNILAVLNPLRFLVSELLKLAVLFSAQKASLCEKQNLKFPLHAKCDMSSRGKKPTFFQTDFRAKIMLVFKLLYFTLSTKLKA